MSSMGRSSDEAALQLIDDRFARDVVDGLTTQPKRLPSKYLYDALGSKLFEAICELPWYKITRGERALLARARAAIVGPLETPATFVELGAGNGEKLSILVEGLAERRRTAYVHIVDISGTALELASRTLSRYTSVTVIGHQTSYAEGLHDAVASLETDRPAMVLFLGSNIGNLGPQEVNQFLTDIKTRLRRDDCFLLGADLVKPERDLVLAYDDPLGVTASFNLNLLARLNRELDADFDLEQFRHQVVWNANDSRIESYLVSRREQTVCVTAAGCCVRFMEGEAIWTESSNKYHPEQLVRLGEDAGFDCREQWIEPDSEFALTLFAVP